MQIPYEQLQHLENQRLSVLEKRLEELNDELRTRPIVRNTNLWELNSEKYRLAHPINIVIEEYPDETVARWPEVETFGSGTTETEAIAILKQDIVSLFEDLIASSDDELGKLPQGWKRILLRFIKTNE